MSNQAFLEFYEASLKTEELLEQMKAITSPQEIIKLGRRNGYCFTLEDMVQASTTYAKENSQKGEENGIAVSLKNSEAKPSENSTRFYHYEFDFLALEGFEEIAREFEKLKIKPSTVDMDLYEKSFREDDFNFASLSPAAPEFQQQYNEIMAPWLNSNISFPKAERVQRHFHLINLDLHVEHPLYEEYFVTKFKILKLLENYFETEIRFSGSLWYPPNAYRLWHTNESQPGWRMYLIDFDNFQSIENEKSFFRYMNPDTKEVVTLYEKPKIVRFFKVEQEPERLFWHCIVNATKSNRWSFGFVVPDNWMSKLRI
ncbi:Nif11-like leader peptide family natural product precursor [Scytonema sp. PCC 10023]|uniref:Nif11-like leader peptide family natural product precursor n=1 Tax=Scytonema sp. PCC 10023 TaxID=1680591 RepID=UPI0039C6907E